MKKNLVFKLVFIILIILICFSPIIKADIPTTIDPGGWDPPELNPSDVDEVIGIAAIIISGIRAFGIIVSVVVLMIMGIKYMTGSIEEKAEYKKTMIPYLLGVFIFFGLSQLLPIIIDVVPKVLE